MAEHRPATPFNRPANTQWNTDKPITLGPKVPCAFGEKQEVFLDGEHIGHIETGLHQPFVNIKGTRQGKSLTERRVWRSFSIHAQQRSGRSINWDTRWRAVHNVVETHVGAMQSGQGR